MCILFVIVATTAMKVSYIFILVLISFIIIVASCIVKYVIIFKCCYLVYLLLCVEFICQMGKCVIHV